ncbi:unnamed protein product [marine sediment metagenome]|uniref:Uncharacterized protein n=1 Tax=marine sediment metagenome TaxID=412755 RepID=X1ITK1_9ZZZZ
MSYEDDEEEEFITHGYYTVSNAIGYEVQLLSTGDAARTKYTMSDGSIEISEWREIVSVEDEDNPGEYVSVISGGKGLGSDIPLDEVMRA